MARILVALMVLALPAIAVAQSFEQERSMRQLEQSNRQLRTESFERDVQQRQLDQSLRNRMERQSIERQIRTQQLRTPQYRSPGLR